MVLVRPTEVCLIEPQRIDHFSEKCGKQHNCITNNYPILKTYPNEIKYKAILDAEGNENVPGPLWRCYV